MLTLWQRRQSRTVPISGDGNVFEKIARIEDRYSHHNEEARNLSAVRFILNICIGFLAGCALMHLICNHAPHSKFKDPQFLSTLDLVFFDHVITEASYFNAGVCCTTLVLVFTTRSHDALAKFIPPLIRFGIFGLVYPSWLYIIIYNGGDISKNLLLQNIWFVAQGFDYCFPCLLMAGVIHVLDVDRVMWSRRTFVIHCSSWIGSTGLIVISNSGWNFHFFYFLHFIFMALILLTVASGAIHWFRRPKQAATVDRRNKNRLISRVIFLLCLFEWGSVIVYLVYLILVPSAGGTLSVNRFRLIVLEATAESLVTLVVIISYIKNLVEQQAEELEEVVTHHAEVFVKPLADGDRSDVDGESVDEQLRNTLSERQTEGIERLDDIFTLANTDGPPRGYRGASLYTDALLQQDLQLQLPTPIYEIDCMGSREHAGDAKSASDDANHHYLMGFGGGLALRPVPRAALSATRPGLVEAQRAMATGGQSYAATRCLDADGNPLPIVTTWMAEKPEEYSTNNTDVIIKSHAGQEPITNQITSMQSDRPTDGVERQDNIIALAGTDSPWGMDGASGDTSALLQQGLQLQSPMPDRGITRAVSQRQDGDMKSASEDEDDEYFNRGLGRALALRPVTRAAYVLSATRPGLAEAQGAITTGGEGYFAARDNGDDRNPATVFTAWTLHLNHQEVASDLTEPSLTDDIEHAFRQVKVLQGHQGYTVLRHRGGNDDH